MTTNPEGGSLAAPTIARTKIVATLGPASGSPAGVRALIAAGVDVFRLNFSHGDHESHGRYVRFVREAAAEFDRHVAVLQDLQGPRIRTGRLAGGGSVTLVGGQQIVLRPGDFAGDARSLAVSYDAIADDCAPGDAVLLSDGLIELEVEATEPGLVRCRVRAGGPLGEHEGINLPGVDVSIGSPTPKDLDDLRLGVELGVDAVALSFVRSAGDILRLKAALDELGAADTPVVAKIEKPEAVGNLREILLVSDGVMVARGDLGIEMATEKVPAAQKQIIHAANALGVPVITATQMLESMVAAPRPTRAEATDVANAILDGTDAVMLSGETSVGHYPEEAVRIMDAIARETEGHLAREGGRRPREPERRDDARQQALARAACEIAAELGAAGIVAFTLSGSTARHVAQRRPAAAIYALAPDPRVCRRLGLVWGVEAVQLDVFDSTDTMVGNGLERLRELDCVAGGQTVVCVAGARTNTPGGTDMLKIHQFA